MPGNDRANSVVESQSVEPSTDLNNPENLNFLDSDEEEQNNQAEGEPGIESETDEAVEDGQESDDTQEQQPDDEPEADGEEPEAKEADDAVVVTLKGGEQVPLEELKLGYMRDRDYRHKTQETANKGKSLDEMTARVVRTVDAIAAHLAGMLPEEPQPTLAIQNPNEYTRQKAIYDSAMAQVNAIIRLANDPKDVAAKRSKEEEDALIAANDEALARSFPQTRKSAEERKKFFDQSFETARDLGFTDEELRGQIDHRYFKLAYYARLGLQAEQAKSKALAKVASAPPAVAIGKAKGAAAQQARANQEAMKKLSKTGSIKDAMSIDFD
ncbi:hypothetical protein [Rhizobium phage RHEph18]|uniref:hypothetical protein n=1 Tax=Rhizobium TaxID=379 RepID=UPI0007E99F5C|nr:MULTISPECIES: hypothetical protein [Rhizobium]ANL02693.1 hypothetical protein AMJ99_CH01106 [Rhizobium esperanzae]ANM33545.1 hypothetical protein AMK04_CH01107 [Rhizobium sp. N871]QIG73695.1 hypothetical protein EVC05_003 [Rhizobium phage RHph_N2]QXV74413.1 hypothetical protein [Rhizobium phage RHEph18]